MSKALGTSGIKVPPLCLGGNVFGWTTDEATSFRILDRAYERGLRFIDTADVYTNWVEGNPGGVSETILGRWIKARGNRTSIVLATKVGARMSREKKGLSRAYIQTAIEDSLARLQTDYVDLYQSHYPDPRTPIEETLAAFDGLIKQGKVRVIGSSNLDRKALEDALSSQAGTALPPYATIQAEYNLFSRAEFEEIEPIYRDNHIGLLSYFSLASGFLTGKYRSLEEIAGAARKEELQKYFTARGERILAALRSISDARATQPSVVALAWLMSRPAVTAAVASASSESQVDQLALAMDCHLNPDELDFLDRESAQVDAAS
jgi:aryl-alcohol dehydrogenase-like predicted oxidoreductase